jgi:hypothetical protein
MTDYGTMSALFSCQLLPHGIDISQLLPRDIYLRLKQHLDHVRSVMPEWITDEQRKKGLTADYLFTSSAENWTQKRPIWVMLMLDSLNKNEIAFWDVPLFDDYLILLAKEQRKRIHAIEKIDDTCRPLNQMGIDKVGTI